MPSKQSPLKVYEAFPRGHRPGQGEQQKLLKQVWLEFPSSVDNAREVARRKAGELTGQEVRSINALHGGGFSVSVEPR